MNSDPNIFWGDVLLCALACIPVLLLVFRKRINWNKRADMNDFEFGSVSRSSTPAFNTDGTAMGGHFDAHGNAHGVRRIQ